VAGSRGFVAVAVVGTFVAGVACLVSGGLATGQIVAPALGGGDVSDRGAKVLAVDVVGMIDRFLLGTIRYVVAAGRSQLGFDPAVPLPGWLHVSTLNDLKDQLLGIVLVLLAVTFLGEGVEWDGQGGLLALGVAVGLVVGVLALTMAVLARAHGAPLAHPAPAPARRRRRRRPV
jgi:uncharacterized membrane protein YqhA